MQTTFGKSLLKPLIPEAVATVWDLAISIHLTVPPPEAQASFGWQFYN